MNKPNAIVIDGLAFEVFGTVVCVLPMQVVTPWSARLLPEDTERLAKWLADASAYCRERETA